jgi:hypothetical protein
VLTSYFVVEVDNRGRWLEVPTGRVLRNRDNAADLARILGHLLGVATRVERRSNEPQFKLVD